MQVKRWTKAEEQYLDENWGNKPVESIARDLGRSVNAVLSKKSQKCLGAFTENGTYVTLNQLFGALGIRNGETYKYQLFKERNAPIKYRRINKGKVITVEISKFWKWAEYNQDIFDFSQFERYALGDEPEWAEKKRNADTLKRKNYRPKAKWTPYEDERLRFMVQSQRYTYADICNDLKRTDGAIRRRILDLKIEGKPLPAAKAYWAEEEASLLNEMILSGYDYNIIGSRIGKTGKAVRGYVYQKYGTERLDRVREILQGV